MTTEPISWTALALACWPLWIAYVVIVVMALARWKAHR